MGRYPVYILNGFNFGGRQKLVKIQRKITGGMPAEGRDGSKKWLRSNYMYVLLRGLCLYTSTFACSMALRQSRIDPLYWYIYRDIWVHRRTQFYLKSQRINIIETLVFIFTMLVSSSSRRRNKHREYEHHRIDRPNTHRREASRSDIRTCSHSHSVDCDCGPGIRTCSHSHSVDCDCGLRRRIQHALQKFILKSLF